MRKVGFGNELPGPRGCCRGQFAGDLRNYDNVASNLKAIEPAFKSLIVARIPAIMTTYTIGLGSYESNLHILNDVPPPAPSSGGRFSANLDSFSANLHRL